MTSHKTSLLIAVAAAVSLAGCASMEDFATNPEKQKTRQGAAIGAAGGAVVGLLIDGGWKGAHSNKITADESPRPLFASMEANHSSLWHWQEPGIRM